MTLMTSIKIHTTDKKKKKQNPDIIEYTEEVRSCSDRVAEQRERRKTR